MHSGVVIHVWADGFQEMDGVYVFGSLVDLTDEELKDSGDLEITNLTPTNRARVIFSTARVPMDAVRSVFSA
jgi:hypothetical protein